MKYNIAIPKPCNQDWNSMSSNSEGKFCDSCKKDVVDFTKLSDKEIFAIISKSKGCGRFTKEQIKKSYQSVPVYKNRFSRFVFSSFLLSPFLTNNLFSKNIEKNKIQIESNFFKLNHLFDKSYMSDSLKNKGKIIDNYGNFVPGASITLKGTTSGLTSNAYGEFEISNFYLKLLNQNSILIFSSIGFKSREITYSDLTEKPIVLEEDTHALMGEVMIVGGYCSTHRSFFQRMIHKLKVGF